MEKRTMIIEKIKVYAIVTGVWAATVLALSGIIWFILNDGVIKISFGQTFILLCSYYIAKHGWRAANSLDKSGEKQLKRINKIYKNTTKQ